MIDGSEKRNRQLAFERRNSHVCEKRSKFIIKQFERSVRSLNVFQHSKRNFVSLRGHVISSIYSSSKLKTETRSDLKISRSSPVSFREIAETSRKVTNLRPQSCPKTSASFHSYFSYAKLPWVAVTHAANPSTWSLLWSDGSHRWVASNPGKAKIIVNRSHLTTDHKEFGNKEFIVTQSKRPNQIDNKTPRPKPKRRRGRWVNASEWKRMRLRVKT